MKTAWIVSAVMMAAGVAGAAQMKEMTWRIPLMDKAPVIDGVVDAAEWAGANGSFGFVKYPSDTVAPIHTEFFVGRTRDRLYLAGTGEIGPGGLKREIRARKGNVDCTKDDTYEFVLVPDSSLTSPDLRHVIVNFNGAYRTQALIDNNMAVWNPDSMETKSTIRDGRWHFEWSVKLDEIGFTKTPADRHAIRFCRNFKNVSNQWGWQSSMRPNEKGFFAAGLAIPSVFDDDGIAVQLVEAPRRDGDTRWNLTLRLHNPTAKTVQVEAKAEGRPVNSQPGITLRSLELKAGETVELPVSGPILGDEKIDLTLDVKADGKQVFFREVMWNPNGPAAPWLSSGDDGCAAKYDFAFYPSYHRTRIRADLSTIEAKKRPASVKVELRSDVAKGKDVLAATELKLDKDGIGDELWDIPDLKAETLKTGVGGYTVTFEAQGVKNGKKTIPFRRDIFEWEGFKGGTSATVPSMFEEVKRKSEKGESTETVSVVLREHIVDKETGLWQQVTAAGKEVLARPMRFVGADDKRQPTTDKRGDDSARRMSLVACQTSWDVDGLCDWRLTLQPGHHEPFSLEIPIRAERAKLFHPCADGMRFNYAGVVPPGEGKVWDSTKSPRTSIIGSYLPYIWIGGPLRGIAVFGESDRGWVIGEGQSTTDKRHDNSTSDNSTGRQSPVACQEVIREPDGTVVLRLNLVQRAVDLKEPRTIHLAFQATPVKPMEKNFRSSPLGELIGSCYYWGGYSASDEVHPYDGTDMFWRKMSEARRTGKVDRQYIDRAIDERVYHCPTNSSDFANTYRCFKAHFNSGMNAMAGSFGKNMKFVWYTNGRGVRLGTPAGATFIDEWTVEPFSSARPLAWGYTKSYSLDPCRSYLDFAAYWWEKALALGIVDYFYWDDVFCQSNLDLVGTESYRTADGDIQPSSGIFNMREQVKRCAVLQAEHGWIDNKNWVHMTNTALAPVLAFAGTNYDWEDVAGDTAIQERYPKETIQAQSLGRQFGNRVAVMGYFATKDPKSEKLKWLHRTGTGACLAHEIQWHRVKEWREADALITGWGYREPSTRVWNYWDEDIPFPVEIQGGENAALAMTREQGGSLVIVSDFKDGGDYTVRPDLAVMSVKPGFRAFNLETGAELNVENGAVKVHLDRLDYIIIELK